MKKVVPDPRCGRTTKHDHAEVLVYLVIGFLAGRTTMCRRNNKYKGHAIWPLMEKPWWQAGSS